MTNNILADYLNKTDDELYIVLGYELLGDGLGIGTGDDDKYRKFGLTWFNNKRRQLQQKLCLHPRLRGLAITSSGDAAAEAAALFEILQDLGESTPNAAVIAVLVSRLGLGAFCAGVTPA
ncbi:hypothetical protein AB0H36_11640 [Kribbella sp. NPDC050820]|uniref:hypothetical protein n=1 Tax=Kribbella sp. NPDC050820 TaxID=3155408 RepID=UPI0033C8455B